ncbi:MAG: DEAD/DEAH box helicase [Nanoarchaeota archaeon]
MNKNKFKQLGLSEQLSKNLEKIGITEPTEIQEKTIPLTLKGKDVIGGSATGSGKTLAFSANIIENIQDKKPQEIQALILTPTRELAEQILNSIKSFSQGFPVKVSTIYGGVDIEKQFRNIPKSNIIVGTPGRILDHLNRKTLNLSKIKYLVLDEVDRMFEMGFQEDVEKILYCCPKPKERQNLLFSATISSEVGYLSEKHSNNPIEISVQSHVDPAKLKQVYYDVPSSRKFPLLVHLLKNESADLVMVFCNTRRNVDFVTQNLKLNNINATAIHGGLTQNKRKNVLSDFHKGQTNVLVCTDVAARGLDIKNVSHVYNYDMSPNSKEYTHRIGRTARAGEEGIAINLISSRDYENFREVIDNPKLKKVIKRRDCPYIPRAKMKIPSRNNKGDNRNRGRFNKSNNKFGQRHKRNFQKKNSQKNFKSKKRNF